MNARALVAQALGALESSGGFSINASGGTPTEGYMVALEGHERVLEHNIPDGMVQYALEHITLLNGDSTLYLGGWTHEGKLYLDISQNVRDYRKAAILGLKRKQIAIWDVTHSREITL